LKAKLVSTAKNIYPSLLLITFFLAAWEIICRWANIPASRVPSPLLIGKCLVADFPLLMSHLHATMYAVSVGLLIAIFLSLILSISMNRWLWLKQALYPLLIISQTIPIIALAPLLLILFGFGITNKIIVVVLVCFFPLSVNLVEGLEQVDNEMINLLRIMQAKPITILQNVQLPSVLPFFYSGLKISVTYSVMGAVIAEWLGGRAGLGIYILRSLHTYRAGNAFAAILVVVTVSLMLFKLTEFAAWISMPWERIKKNNLED